MKTGRILALLGVVVLCLGTMTASAAPEPVLVRSVIGGGGQRVAAGSFVLHGTVGEAIVSQPLAAADCWVASGYWRNLPQDYEVHLPMLRK